MIEHAILIDLSADFSIREIYDLVGEVVELNGNPFYHRWYMNDYKKWIPDAEIINTKKIKIDSWLKEQGLTEHDIIILTGGW
jgi:hypothetical protein